MDGMWAFFKFILFIFVVIPLCIVTFPISIIFLIAYWLGKDSMKSKINR